MAELFLQEFGPVFISRPTSPDVGCDLLVGFRNEQAGINTFAVDVRATEQPPPPLLQIPRRTYDRLAHSNIPAILLVADVKQNRLYRAWIDTHEARLGTSRVSLPLAEIDEAIKHELRTRFDHLNGRATVAGGAHIA